MDDPLSLYFTPAPHLSAFSYVALGAVTALFWALVTWVCHMVCAQFNALYLDKDSKDKHTYVSYLVSLIHAPFAVVNSVLCCYFLW